MLKLLANDLGGYLPLVIIGGLLLFFGLIVLIIILVKKHVGALQIKKDDIDEETAVRQELDRLLVPIEDEEIQKEMEDIAKKEEIKDASKDEVKPEPDQKKD